MMRRCMADAGDVDLMPESRKTGIQPYSAKAAENARKFLRALVSECEENHTRAAKVLGVSQSTVSRLVAAGSTQQPTLAVLVALRERFQVPIDQILGLPQISPAGYGSISELREILRHLLSRIDVVDGPPEVKRIQRG